MTFFCIFAWLFYCGFAASVTYDVTASFPTWTIAGFTSPNPTLHVHSGDVITFNLHSGEEYPFAIFTNDGLEYVGFKSINIDGRSPTLTVGTDVAGKTLFYACPSYFASVHMFGSIVVAPLSSGKRFQTQNPNTPLPAPLPVSTKPVDCDCTKVYMLSASFPSWSFSGSAVGNLVGTVVNLAENVWGLNPVLEVNVGDIISFHVTTTPQYPFSVWSSVNSVYAGFSATQGYVSGPYPTLTIGEDVAGKTLYYVCPPYFLSDQMFGVIKVTPNSSPIISPNPVPVKSSHDSSSFPSPVLSPVPSSALRDTNRYSIVPSASSHSWSFEGSILGFNPVLEVNVGDEIVFPVKTTQEHPFSIYLNSTSVYSGFSEPEGYVSGPYPTLKVGEDVAGKTLYYVCPPHFLSRQMFGLIMVAPLSDVEPDEEKQAVSKPTLRPTSTLESVPARSQVTECDCHHKYIISASYPSWSFDGSVVGNLMKDVVPVDDVVGASNPTLEARVGDIISFQVTTTNQFPFTIWSNTEQVYSGFSAKNGYVSGPNPKLVIGEDVAGKTLYYVSPPYLSNHMFGLIKVAPLVPPPVGSVDSTESNYEESNPQETSNPFVYLSKTFGWEHCAIAASLAGIVLLLVLVLLYKRKSTMSENQKSKQPSTPKRMRRSEFKSSNPLVGKI